MSAKYYILNFEKITAVANNFKRKHVWKGEELDER